MASKVIFGIVTVLVVAWSALFFSNRGLLVGSKAPEGGVGLLTCRYFTGTNFVDRTHIYKTALGLGRDTCPRVVVATE